MKLAFILQFGTSQGDFYSGVLHGLLAADVRAAGHEAQVVHVYGDAQVREQATVDGQLTAWLDREEIDTVVLDRMLGPGLWRRFRSSRPGREVVLAARSEGFDRVDEIDWVLIDDPHRVTPGLRAHPTDDFRRAFLAWLVSGDDAERARAPGFSRVSEGVAGPPAVSLSEARSRDRLPFNPVVERVVLGGGQVAPMAHYTVFGNSGCPYGRDSAEAAPYRVLPMASAVARFGCSFCHMGGDYEKRADAEVVRALVEQARYLLDRVPDLDRLLLSDQNPQRYLPLLFEELGLAGVRPVRWMFQTRADSLLRDLGAVEKAATVARRTGAVLELYLVGFESFCAEELERYNKGVTPDVMLRAIAAMRELRKTSGGAFRFSDARGHSLILFNPWTEPRHVGESADAMRAHGLGELFRDVAANRLRLYPQLPIHQLAAHDGLLSDAFAGSAVAGSARKKGYSAEAPWRFRDRRTELLYELAAVLRRRLGVGSEIAQLRAASRFAEDQPDTVDVPATLERVERALTRLEVALDGASTDVRLERAAMVRFALACNNGCGACRNRDEYLDDDEVALGQRVDRARQEGGPLVFVGREPTLHSAFVRLVERGRGGPLAVLSNARRFAHRPFLLTALKSGLTSANVKLFGATEAVSDRVTRDPGAHRQTLMGARNLGSTVTFAAVAMLYADSLPEATKVTFLAAKLGATGLSIDVAIDAIGIDRLDEATDAVLAMVSRAGELGLPIRASRATLGGAVLDLFPVPVF